MSGLAPGHLPDSPLFSMFSVLSANQHSMEAFSPPASKACEPAEGALLRPLHRISFCTCQDQPLATLSFKPKLKQDPIALLQPSCASPGSTGRDMKLHIQNTDLMSALKARTPSWFCSMLEPSPQPRSKHTQGDT